MWVSTNLKCPEDADWLAITRVTPDGDVISLGYLNPEAIAGVVETIRPLLARVPEEGHQSAATVEAWSDFVHWAEVVAGLVQPTPPIGLIEDAMASIEQQHEARMRDLGHGEDAERTREA